MTQFMPNLLILCVQILLLSIGLNCRQLSLRLNPDCEPEAKCSVKDLNLAQIESKGDNDLIHYLWSSVSCIPPSLIIIKSDLQTNVTIDWNKLFTHMETDCKTSKELRDFIDINGNVNNSIDFQIRRLFFFSDVNKTGSYNPDEEVLEALWDKSNGFLWNQTIVQKNSSDSMQLSFVNQKLSSNETELLEINGTIRIDLRIDNSDGRTDELPHLAFTDRSASLQLTLDDVKINDTRFPDPRIMAVIDLKSDKPVTEPDFDELIKIDDEYTPGVFKQITFNLKKDKKATEEEINSFVSWKPIAYNSNEKIIANTFDIIHQKVKNDNSSDHLRHTFNLTFGAPDDSVYYSDNNYATFAMVVGVGSAPTDELSLLVKLVIAVGFGLPALIMIVSAVYIIVKKVRNRNANNLLLSQTN